MRCRVIVPLMLLFVVLVTPALPNPGPPLCLAPDTTLSTSAIPAAFAPFRSGTFGFDRRYRDLEFLWDSLYTNGITQDVETTLDNFASAIVDSLGYNPFGIPVSDFHLIYDYFRREGGKYPQNPFDTTSVVIGWFNRLSEGDTVSAYNPQDRSHVDVYIFSPSRGLNQGGTYPATFISGEEDLSTGHSADDVKHGNALDIQGPPSAQMLDLDGTGWTRPNAAHVLAFNHEFQHTLPPDQGKSYIYTEMFSAGAEAIGGGIPGSPTDEMAYTWSLLSHNPPSSPPCTLVTHLGSNYQARSAFMAYLAYNFAGTDTSASLAAIEDDLLHRWARTSVGENYTRWIESLRGLLTNDSCGTCAVKDYLNPNGQPTDTTSRLGLIHHNFRVANYVNNPNLDEGQYGFGFGTGFSPAAHLGAWQSIDGCGIVNDLVAIPPEITLTDRFLTRDTTLAGIRSYGGSSLPLTLQPYGAEYWIIRSDPSLHNSGQELVVRVHSDGLAKRSTTGICAHSGPQVEDGTLHASVVTYVEQDEPGGAPGEIWDHPAWAADALPPRVVVPDSLSRDLEFVVSSFGDSVKAVLVVLTMADGPTQFWSARGGDGISDRIEQGRYRLNLSVRAAPFASTNPIPFEYSSTLHEEQASWSPTSDSLVYLVSPVSGGSPGLYIRALESGTPFQIVASTQVQSSPEWSPRGDKILFSQTRALDPYEDLYVLDRPSGTTTLLTSGLNGVETCGAFQPNGQRIAYVLHRADSVDVLQDWEIRLVNTNATNDVLLVSRGPGANVRSPRWTQDGKWLYFTANDSLYAVGTEWPTFGQVIAHSALLDSVTTVDLFMVGPRMLLEEPGHAKYPDICTHTNLSVDTVDVIVHPFRRLALRDTVRNLTEPIFYQTGASYWSPRLSPDGTLVAFTSDQYNVGQAKDLFVGQISWNHPPQFVDVPRDTVVTSCTPLIIQLGAIDPDGEGVTYSGAYLPPGASLSASGLFAWNEARAGEHFVVFRAIDAAGGVAHRVVRISVPDQVRPAPVSDLLAEFVSSTMVGLTFTAVGDDSLTGAACQYVLKRWNEPITEANWNVATSIPTNAPGLSGTTESAEVYNLQPSTTYYFALKTRDEAYQFSALSNVISVTTLSGGGGFAARRAGNASVQRAAQAASGSEQPATPTGSMVAALERQEGGLSWMIFRTSDEFVAPRPEETSEPRLLIQVRDGDGWRTDASFQLAHACSLIALRGSPRTSSRVVLTGPQEFMHAAGEARGGGDAAAGMQVVDAVHSRLGSLITEEASDLGHTNMTPGDTLVLNYMTGDTEAEPTDWYLLFRRASTPPASTARQPESIALPMEFGLAQNHPNPFSSVTTIRFQLPREEYVTLEIFDAQGRRVGMLADGNYPAGYHDVDWRRAESRGGLVQPGIYVYRIRAGSFHDQKKLVLLP